MFYIVPLQDVEVTKAHVVWVIVEIFMYARVVN
jgi:hypothetical protein